MSELTTPPVHLLVREYKRKYEELEENLTRQVAINEELAAHLADEHRTNEGLESRNKDLCDQLEDLRGKQSACNCDGDDDDDHNHQYNELLYDLEEETTMQQGILA